ncbi:MAG: hypothetical protein ACT4O6_25635 [Reyranella sp.]
MQVHPSLLLCTAFIGQPISHGRFRARGTGFFVNVPFEDYDFGYFITAKHLLWPNFSHREAQRPEGSVWIRFSALDGPPIPKETPVSDWIFHPDRFVDLCAYPMPTQEDGVTDLNFLNLGSRTSAIPERLGPVSGVMLQRELTLGEEVFIVGTFVGRVGERKNIPVIRVANIAALPLEPVEGGSPRHPAYLIETRSLGGTSGSPVLLNPLEQRHDAEPGAIFGPHGVTNTRTNQSFRQILVPYKLVGMVLGAHSGNYAEDFVSETDTDIRPDKSAPREDADFNAGISVVLPIQQVYDFLNTPDMVKAREATVDARRKESGYFPTAASRKNDAPTPTESARPPIEGDDQHAERFTALLDAAVGKPKQGG